MAENPWHTVLFAAVCPVDFKACHARFARQNLAHQMAVVDLRWRVLVHLRYVVGHVYVQRGLECRDTAGLVQQSKQIFRVSRVGQDSV